MKLKNTLGVVIGSMVAATSVNALAQGQGAVEVEAFGKHYFTDSSRDIKNGELYGAGVSYFLTDDVSLGLSYGEYHDITSEDRVQDGSHKKIKGSLTSLDAAYHFGNPGVGLRPYVSAGVAHQSIGQADRGGRDRSTFANVGTGLKYYFTENFFAKASVDGMYNIDADEGEWMAGVGVGLNFGGGARQVAAVEPTPEPAPAPIVDNEPEPAPEVVRVELDVKFDFDKSRVREESYSDIKNLADFMQQYPQTTTTVEGHTDSVGTDQYNQRLSERRAEAVRNVLVNEYGVQGNRVNSVGYGESRPVADNSTEEGRQINRRVEAEVEAQVQ
ncbi:OmpA family protein [Pseudomonas stutzeri]|uniref:OmpA family protein n=1 Tax=Stutzerimonas stutzeri TaxID=316 RepID=UPI00025498AC|nr:OmpA family protein [Stutzerimonas stutzeri]MDH2241624.1 OmpA family protein [Pseudomonas sp. GD03909]MDH2245655.1 OmpA family protein [Pseudomonas sp. GD03856]MDH2264655.1 OmpA family protein [Pseudomonas sp. GD03855]NMY62492.1 OmpA family protein [Pseudomonas sp. WS 5018]HAJ86487.1 OmpA family protein [Pseudomonas sp.]